MPRWALATGGSAAALATALALASLALLEAEAEPLWLMALSVGVVVAWIAWQDFADFTIPDAAVLALGVLGAAFRLPQGASAGEPFGETLLLMGLDLTLSGGLLLLVREIYFRRRGHDGMGFGDVKLAAAGGVLAGTSGFAWALLAASLLGITLALMRGGKASRLAHLGSADKLPFGAILAPALWVVWLTGHSPHWSALAP